MFEGESKPTEKQIKRDVKMTALGIVATGYLWPLGASLFARWQCGTVLLAAPLLSGSFYGC